VETESITVSTVYTFAMPKYVYVQVHGVDKAAKIEADEAVESGTKGTNDNILSLKLKGTQVGSFKATAVDGWWIQDE
jgi:hypothetical protein